MQPDLPHQPEYRVGILSDTHGHISPTALKWLNDVDLIIHAGDIDTPGILPVLARMAPLVAVRGNMDGPWAADLSLTETAQVGKIWIFVLHDLTRLDLAPEAAGFDIVISGHTHRSHLLRKSGILYLNPGSATHPRHSFPASMALLRIRKETVTTRFIDLDHDRLMEGPFNHK